MAEKNSKSATDSLDAFLAGKSAHAVNLFNHFVAEFLKIGPVAILPAKTMIGIATARKRVVYVTQFGRNFIHVVFPFEQPFPDNLCFQKIAKVPGTEKQFNHHFRMLANEDVNAEVRKFMRLALREGQ